MRHLLHTTAALIAVSLVGGAPKTDEALPLHVLYLGNTGTQRAEAFESFLREHFVEVSVARRDAFNPAAADDADVVLLDWSQRDTNSREAASPLGPRGDWEKPTVLLGSAGHLLASPWEVIGGTG